jgi:hypothetical protein
LLAIGRNRTLRDDASNFDSTFRAEKFVTQGAADQVADAASTSRDRAAEESHIESGGAVVDRVCSRGREAIRKIEVASQSGLESPPAFHHAHNHNRRPAEGPVADVALLISRQAVDVEPAGT